MDGLEIRRFEVEINVGMRNKKRQVAQYKICIDYRLYRYNISNIYIYIWDDMRKDYIKVIFVYLILYYISI